MRLWSIHPKYLDRLGLLACWREALLAQQVLRGATRGYRDHPQLERFRSSTTPMTAIATYLDGIAAQADLRGYHFCREKIGSTSRLIEPIPVTRGQVIYEWEHLKRKLSQRDPQRLSGISDHDLPELHPVFTMVEGQVESWERVH